MAGNFDAPLEPASVEGPKKSNKNLRDFGNTLIIDLIVFI